MEKDSRQQQLKDWALARICELQPAAEPTHWSMVSGDASFRRYFRWAAQNRSWICVDAPPEHENSEQFIKVANLLQAVNAPKVLAYDLAQGFMLLSDLGDQLYLPLLNEASADKLYRAAIDSLIEMQAIAQADQLPAYDESLLRFEMELFREWFLGHLLEYEPSAEEHTLLDQTFELLIASAQQQPQVFVHRDYHSRNIMYVEGASPGIIDFQDAVYGPISYDLLSLLRDCYIEWPQDKVWQWVEYYRQRSPYELDSATFRRWFDWMGLQRHIKVAGIFARLNFRDGKPGYLKDIPLTLKYIVQQAKNYPDMQPFYQWMQQTIMPLYQQKAQPSVAGASL